MHRPRLDIRHLAMVEAIARIGSISGAGRALGLTQPAISRQLKEAERRLGVDLVHRDGNATRLTVAGETIVQCAQRVLYDLAHSERSAAIIPDEPPLTLRLGLGHYDEYGWFPSFFEATGRSDPDLNLTIVATGEVDLFSALDDHVIDLAVAAGPIDKRRFSSAPLFDDELVAVSHADHPFAGLTHLEAEHFVDHAYATFGITYHKGFDSDRLLLPAGAWPSRVITLGSVSAILDLVEQNQAITVLSSWTVERRLARSKILTRPITASGLPVTWSAVVRRTDGPRSPALQLAKHLQRWCGGTSHMFGRQRTASP